MTPSTDAVLRGPVACAAFLAAQQWGYTADQVCQPDIAFAVAAEARKALDPWSDDQDLIIRRVLDRREEVRRLASAVLGNPASVWWSAPVDRNAQVLEAGALSPERPGIDDAVSVTSSDYAQTALEAVITSTRVGRDTCWDAFADQHIGDNDPLPSSIRTLLRVDGRARVFEIHSPEDWQALVSAYPLERARLERGGPSPDWAAAATDWDGIHLSFLGFISSTYAPAATGPEGSVLWAWDCEQTRWLRNVFIGREDVPAAAPSDRPRQASSPLKFLGIPGTPLRSM